MLARAAVFAALSWVLVYLITAASDEGAIAWGVRAGRSLPLAPLCAGVGVWGVLAPLRARGDLRALEALGRRPAEIGAAAAMGGALAAFAAALLVGAVPAVDASGFYPRAAPTPAWQWRDGAFEDRELGLRVGVDGTPARFAPPREAPAGTGLPPAGRLAAALATSVSALALATLTAGALVRGRASRVHGARSAARGARRLPVDAGVAALAAAATVAAFQGAAAHRIPAMGAVLPPFALLAFAVQRYLAMP